MPNILNIFPPTLIFLTVVLVILPTILAVILRHTLYRYLINSANKVSRLLTFDSRGKQPQIVEDLEARFRQASLNLEQVNTMALIDGLYSQERLKFLGMSLRCEQWDYFCKALPNLLLSFGLLGTFIGISSNLYNLSQTIDRSATDIDNLVSQLQAPLQSMGIAFITSLIAIFCSSVLIIVNLRCNTNFAKSCLISSLEDYLDNIFKIDVQGDTRLDKAVDRMVKQQEEFLSRFHERVGQVLETTLGNAANKMVDANQDFQNNVNNMVSRFNDISSSMAASSNSWQESVGQLKEQTEIVQKVVPKFTNSVGTIATASQVYFSGAEKIENSKFSENLENITKDLADTYKSFSQSTAFLGNQVHKISENNQKATELAERVYNQMETASSQIQDSSVGFVEAAETFKESNFADKLTTATKQLTTIPQKFDESTQTLHQSSDTLSKAIENLNTYTQVTNTLIRNTNDLNQKSTELLTTSDRNIQQEITELNRMVDVLTQHKEQVNNSLTNFGGKILTNFQEQSQENISQLQNLNTEIKNSSQSFQLSQVELSKLIETLDNYQNQFNSINSNLNGIGMTSDRLLKNFEQKADNNTQNITRLVTEIKNLINTISQH